jgi:hypothetical protein
MTKEEWIARAQAEYLRLDYPIDAADIEAAEAWNILSDRDRDIPMALSRNPEDVVREIVWHYRTASAPDA